MIYLYYLFIFSTGEKYNSFKLDLLDFNFCYKKFYSYIERYLYYYIYYQQE